MPTRRLTSSEKELVRAILTAEFLQPMPALVRQLETAQVMTDKGFRVDLSVPDGDPQTDVADGPLSAWGNVIDEAGGH